MRAAERAPDARDGEGPAADPARAGWHAALAVVLSSLLVVLVAWASLLGPDEVFTGPGPTPGTETTTTPADSPEAPEPTDIDAEEPPPPQAPPWWVELLVWALQGAVLLGAVVGLGLVVRAVRSLWEERRRRDDPPLDVDFATLTPGTRVAQEVHADAAAHDALLAAGSPRNAIVAAWHRFELQGERAGVARAPWETSSEFTVRMLDLVGAESGAVIRLGELYREARFSRHEIGEEHRAAALEALARIRASMGGAR